MSRLTFLGGGVLYHTVTHNKLRRCAYNDIVPPPSPSPLSMPVIFPRGGGPGRDRGRGGRGRGCSGGGGGRRGSD
jgi:hypothetical protein